MTVSLKTSPNLSHGFYVIQTSYTGLSSLNNYCAKQKHRFVSKFTWDLRTFLVAIFCRIFVSFTLYQKLPLTYVFRQNRDQPFFCVQVTTDQNGFRSDRHTKREITKLMHHLVSLKSDVGSMEDYGGYKQYKTSLICTRLVLHCLLCSDMINMAATFVGCNKEQLLPLIRFCVHTV